MIVGPSRTTHNSGVLFGLFGLRRYCQSQRRRLAAAASGPNTRRYSASTPRWSSGRYRSTSGMLLGDVLTAQECNATGMIVAAAKKNYRSACGGAMDAGRVGVCAG